MVIRADIAINNAAIEIGGTRAGRTTVGDISDLLTYGIRRFAPLLVIVMLLSFITRCVSYIFNIIL